MKDIFSPNNRHYYFLNFSIPNGNYFTNLPKRAWGIDKFIDGIGYRYILLSG